MVEYRDIDYIDTLINNYSGKTIILDVPQNQEIDWHKVRNYNILSQKHLMLRLRNIEENLDNIKELEIPFFFAYPVNSFYDLRYLKELGVLYAYVDAPIFFQMPEVKKIGVPIRLLPHLANYSTWNFKRKKAPYGTWIRPENIKNYEGFAEVVDFSYPPYTQLLPKQEEALYRIYHDDQEWPGDIQMVIQDIGLSANNAIIFDEEVARRLTCGQRCQVDSICHYCERVLDFAAQELQLQEYKKLKEEGKLKTVEELEET